MLDKIPFTMYAVSTEQNTANVLPALQLGVKAFCFLESEKACQNEWSKGANTVFQKRNIKCLEPLKFSDKSGSNIAELTQLLLEKAGQQAVIWNLGGGLKPHQLAIWNAMRIRQEQGIADMACYASPESGEIQLIFSKYGPLQQVSVRMHTDIDVEELLNVFGHTVHHGKCVSMFSEGEMSQITEVVDLMGNPTFREYLFRLAGVMGNRMDNLQHVDLAGLKLILNSSGTEFQKYFLSKVDEWEAWLLKMNLRDKLFSKSSIRKSVFDNLASNVRKSLFNHISEIVENQESQSLEFSGYGDELQEVFKLNGYKMDNAYLVDTTGYVKFADYFESLVIWRMMHYMKHGKHGYVKSYSNVHIAPIGANKETAEYDVLCITDTGSFHAFDAKTFTFANKDYDARMLNLTRASGRFVKFIAVIPFDPEDLNQDWYPRQMIDEVWEYDKQKKPFYVIADSRDDDFYVSKERDLITGQEFVQVSDHGPGIRCRLLKNAFK